MVVSVLGGTFYFLEVKSNPQKSVAQAQLPLSNLNSQDQSNPKIALSNFLAAAKAKNLVLAKTFISANSNREVFKSVVDAQYNGASIYKKNFTYEITDVKNNDDQVSAELKVKITVGGQSIPIEYLLGKESGKWYLLDEWVLLSSAADVPSNFSDLLNNPKAGGGPVVIRLTGPAHVSIYHPIFGTAGFEASAEANRKLDAGYINQDDPTVVALRQNYLNKLPKMESLSLAISGVWVLKVTGTAQGDFELSTEGPPSSPKGTFKGNIGQGEKKYFSLNRFTDPSAGGVNSLTASYWPLN